MISDAVRVEIDRTIKNVWLNEICSDYAAGKLIKEASLQCSLYHHLQEKLSEQLRQHNLFIYPEFYFRELKYFADLAIVQMDMSLNTDFLGDRVTDVAAVIELKYDGGYAKSTSDYIRSDIPKLKEYIKKLPYNAQYYFGVIFEAECWWLNWADKRASNSWAKGYLTELNAGYLDEKMFFEINSYNGMNDQNMRTECKIKWQRT